MLTGLLLCYECTRKQASASTLENGGVPVVLRNAQTHHTLKDTVTLSTRLLVRSGMRFWLNGAPVPPSAFPIWLKSNISLRLSCFAGGGAASCAWRDGRRQDRTTARIQAHKLRSYLLQNGERGLVHKLQIPTIGKRYLSLPSNH